MRRILFILTLIILYISSAYVYGKNNINYINQPRVTFLFYVDKNDVNSLNYVGEDIVVTQLPNGIKFYDGILGDSEFPLCFWNTTPIKPPFNVEYSYTQYEIPNKINQVIIYGSSGDYPNFKNRFFQTISPKYDDQNNVYIVVRSGTSYYFKKLSSFSYTKFKFIVSVGFNNVNYSVVYNNNEHIIENVDYALGSPNKLRFIIVSTDLKYYGHLVLHYIKIYRKEIQIII